MLNVIIQFLLWILQKYTTGKSNLSWLERAQTSHAERLVMSDQPLDMRASILDTLKRWVFKCHQPKPNYCYIYLRDCKKQQPSWCWPSHRMVGTNLKLLFKILYFWVICFSAPRDPTKDMSWFQGDIVFAKEILFKQKATTVAIIIINHSTEEMN